MDPDQNRVGGSVCPAVDIRLDLEIPDGFVGECLTIDAHGLFSRA